MKMILASLVLVSGLVQAKEIDCRVSTSSKVGTVKTVGVALGESQKISLPHGFTIKSNETTSYNFYILEKGNSAGGSPVLPVFLQVDGITAVCDEVGQI